MQAWTQASLPVSPLPMHGRMPELYQSNYLGEHAHASVAPRGTCGSAGLHARRPGQSSARARASTLPLPPGAYRFLCDFLHVWWWWW